MNTHQATHTPIFEHNDDCSGRDEYCTCKTHMEGSFCFVDEQCPKCDRDEDARTTTAAAKKKLEDAAPELLEALQDITERMRELARLEKLGGQYHRSMGRAEAAIARATGGAS